MKNVLNLHLVLLLLSTAICGLVPHLSVAQEVSRNPARQKSVVVKSIDVIGSKKIEKDAVISRLATKIGEKLSKENVRKDVQELFKTGYFYNIKVDEKRVSGGVQLIYRLTEKPSIAQVVFAGNNEIDDEE